ncbi:MAG: heterodisulfide reductase subunit C [Euryarchaeota archaeon]|nr:heterodisulfide reductase subunit C [Euryarchaeota archaeon]MDP6363834.1 4Fe-4S dicluster domain-containing protein [Candidatus Poseidoniia archaeon]MDP6846638.1 4Fe-4S dicluster domain-containing protein [Candidatus Poseidoniia archaeon]MDP7006907.1 4Fe-4S dicluster domain-containing protein [Candidatus Poseidoniia archaeon]
MLSLYKDAGYQDVLVGEKQALFDQVAQDMRYPHELYGCYECGICVAACPSARFYDFSPRVFAQVMAREDVHTFYELLNDSVWDCSQCFSCTCCPRENNPGAIITIMREVAVNNGLASAKEALQAYSRIIFKVMSTGTQVSPDMLQPDFFPDWGPDVRDVSENLDIWRRAIPPETMHTVELAWDVSEKTRLELYMIWKLTGNLEMIENIDEGLFMILEEVMEELLEEHGYDIDDFDNILEG